LVRPARVQAFLELAFADIFEQPHSAAHGTHEQIKLAVTVNVGKRGAGGMLALTRDAGLARDIFKPPVAQIAKQNVRTFDPAEIQIAKPIAIEISRRDARSVFEDSILAPEVG
jgi:hypothetical protein